MPACVEPGDRIPRVPLLRPDDRLTAGVRAASAGIEAGLVRCTHPVQNGIRLAGRMSARCPHLPLSQRFSP